MLKPIGDKELKEISTEILNEINKTNPNHKFTKYAIKNIIAKAIGFENIEHMVLRREKLKITNNTYINDFEILVDNKLKIIDYFSKYDIEIKKIQTIEKRLDSFKELLKSETFNYTLPQYMNLYRAIHEKTIGFSNDIIQFEELKKYSKELVLSIWKRRDNSKEIIFEEDVCKRKKANNEQLSACDLLLYKITKSPQNEESLRKLTFELNEEISRIKKLYNVKIKRPHGSDELNVFKIIDIKKQMAENKDRSFVNRLNDLSLGDESVIGYNKEQGKGFLSKINKKETVFNLSKKDWIEGSCYIVKSVGAGSNEMITNLNTITASNGDGLFYFDNDYAQGEHFKLNEMITYLGYYSKMIFISENEILSLSKEKIREYVKHNRIVFFALGESYRLPQNKRLNILKKIEEILNTISEVKKEKGTGVCFSNIEYILDGTIEGRRFYDNFNLNRKNKYIPAKMYFTFVGDFHGSTKKFKNDINTILSMKTEDPSFWKEINIEKREEYIGENNEKNFLRDMKNLHPGEFIVMQNKCFPFKMAPFKIPYSNVSLLSHVLVDMNE